MIIRRVDAAGSEPVIDAEHGPLDDVGGGALQGGVDGGALGGLAALHLAGVDFAQVQAATEDRLHVALLMGQRPGCGPCSRRHRGSG